MNQWRKKNPKPGTKGQVFEAIVLTSDNIDEVAAWCGGDRVEEKDPFTDVVTHVGLNIPSMGSRVRASEMDVILKSASGIFFVEKDYGRWEAMFELVDQGQEPDTTPTRTDDPFEGMKRA